MAALLAKVTSELNLLGGKDRDLASFLLQRVLRVQPNKPTSMLDSSSWLASDEGKFLGELFKWVKPEELLGRGTTGSVHKAIWLGTPVAKKTFQGREPRFHAGSWNPIEVVPS